MRLAHANRVARQSSVLTCMQTVLYTLFFHVTVAVMIRVTLTQTCATVILGDYFFYISSIYISVYQIEDVITANTHCVLL